MRIHAFTSTLVCPLLASTGVHADSGSGLYSPGLQPLMTRANVLSSGQFSEAARTYSEAIAHSPSDDTIPPSTASRACWGSHRCPRRTPCRYIYTKDGDLATARAALAHYTDGEERDALSRDIADGEAAAKQAGQERSAQLCNACGECDARVGGVDTWRCDVECALEAGDVEGAVGHMRYVVRILLSECGAEGHVVLPNLLPESQTQELNALIFRLSFFRLPVSPVASNALKCLHSDPESRLCPSTDSPRRDARTRVHDGGGAGRRGRLARRACDGQGKSQKPPRSSLPKTSSCSASRRELRKDVSAPANAAA
ncbi:hypothetical protein MKEN_01313000 [Mycena kentingensis (nom. inval.)]|nr:hypothetical protein MKEN_01313000 [Mycena kentingensis (nom. inval.)]